MKNKNSKSKLPAKKKPFFQKFISIVFDFKIEEDGNVPEIMLMEKETGAFLMPESKNATAFWTNKIFCHKKHLHRFISKMNEESAGKKATFHSTGMLVSTPQGCYVFIPQTYSLLNRGNANKIVN